MQKYWFQSRYCAHPFGLDLCHRPMELCFRKQRTRGAHAEDRRFGAVWIAQRKPGEHKDMSQQTAPIVYPGTIFGCLKKKNTPATLAVGVFGMEVGQQGLCHLCLLERQHGPFPASHRHFQGQPSQHLETPTSSRSTGRRPESGDASPLLRTLPRR